MGFSKEENISDLIKTWKENGVHHAHFVFSCGGDSMGDTSLEYFDKDGNIIENSELDDATLTDIVYDKVEFYVNSDGYYEGESGTVTITINEQEDGFQFNKEAQEEYNENYDVAVEYPLSKEELEYINAHISVVAGEKMEPPEEMRVDYKGDFIQSDEDENTEYQLKKGLVKFIDEYVPEVPEDGELNDEWCRFVSNLSTVETLSTPFLPLTLSYSVTIYKPGK